MAHPNARLPQLDIWTADSLRQMIGYIKNDRQIAQHLGIDEKHVRLARTRRPRVRRSRRQVEA
jgi:hypothetical protein